MTSGNSILNALMSAIFLTSLVCVSSATAQAVQTQDAETAGVYKMPDMGNQSTADRVGAEADTVLPRPGIPIGEAELAKIKRQTSGAPAEAIADTAPELSKTNAPDPLLIQRECNTNGPSGFAPPDIHGAVSKRRLVVVTNVDIGVYKKSDCTAVSFTSLKSFFGGFAIPGAETLFDPRVIWDPDSQRFLVIAESNNASNGNQFLYFAVSTNQLATKWKRWRFVLSRASTGTVFCKNAASDFYDYPNTGVNKHKWFVTSNNFPNSGGAYGTILSVRKLPSLSGNAKVTGFCRRNLAFNIAPPIVWDQNPVATFLAARNGSIIRYQLDTTAAADTFSTPAAYSVAAWTAPPDCRQPNGQKLDSLDGRFQSASIQHGAHIWNAHTIRGTSTPSRIRWYRLKTNAGATVKIQKNFVSSHTDGCVFNPSFATSNKFSAFITLSETSPNTKAAFWVWQGPRTKTTGWTTNIIQVSSKQFKGCNSMSRGSCRWGDYSSAQVDPSVLSGRRMWGCNELVNGTTHSSWRTRCAQVKR